MWNTGQESKIAPRKGEGLGQEVQIPLETLNLRLLKVAPGAHASLCPPQVTPQFSLFAVSAVVTTEDLSHGQKTKQQQQQHVYISF